MIYLPRLKVLPIVCCVVAVYFVYHGIYGAHGLRRLKQVRTEIALARQVADEIQAHRSFLEVKVKSLSATSLDRDQLEESARHFLSMAKPEEIILLTGPEK